MSPQLEEIAAAVETLRQAGVQGLEHLCGTAVSNGASEQDSSSWYNNDDYGDVLPPCGSLSQAPSSLTENESGAMVTRNAIGAIISVFCVAVAAGLFLGLMTLDVLDLEILVRCSVDDDEIKYAKTLLPIVRDRHRLLVTLLIMDTLA